jgi:hypothetical protein
MIGESHADTNFSIQKNLDNLFVLNYTEKFREDINFFIEVTDTQVSHMAKLYRKSDKIIHGSDRSKARKQQLSELREDVDSIKQLPMNKIRRKYNERMLNPSSSDILHVYSADHDNSFDVAFGNCLITFSQRTDLPNIFSKFFNESIVPLLGEFYNSLKITDEKFTKYNGLDVIKTIIEDFNNMLNNDFYIIINYISLLNDETEFINMITQLNFFIKRLSIDYFSFLKIISTNFSHTGGKNNIIFYGGFWHIHHLVRIFETFDLKLMRSALNSDKNNDNYKKLCETNKKFRTPHFDEEFRFNSCVSFPKCESSEHSNSTSKLKEETPIFIAEDDDYDLYSSSDDNLDELIDMIEDLKIVSFKRKKREEEEPRINHQMEIDTPRQTRRARRPTTNK